MDNPETNLEIKPAKVYQGSAIYDAFGGCIFTPYDSNPAENSPWTVLVSDTQGKIACTKNIVKLEIKIKRTAPNEVVAKFRRIAALLISDFCKDKVVKKYKESAKSPITPEVGSHSEQRNPDPSNSPVRGECHSGQEEQTKEEMTMRSIKAQVANLSKDEREQLKDAFEILLDEERPHGYEHP